MTNLTLPGRHSPDDIRDLFTKSGSFNQSPLFDGHPLAHHPFLVFVVTPDGVTVRLSFRSHVPFGAKVDPKYPPLLEYPDETWVMAQWEGEKQSHWFKFQVGQWRRFYEDHISQK